MGETTPQSMIVRLLMLPPSCFWFSSAQFIVWLSLSPSPSPSLFHCSDYHSSSWCCHLADTNFLAHNLLCDYLSPSLLLHLHRHRCSSNASAGNTWSFGVAFVPFCNATWFIWSACRPRAPSMLVSTCFTRRVKSRSGFFNAWWPKRCLPRAGELPPLLLPRPPGTYRHARPIALRFRKSIRRSRWRNFILSTIARACCSCGRTRMTVTPEFMLMSIDVSTCICVIFTVAVAVTYCD